MTKLVHGLQLYLAVAAVALGQAKVPANNRYEVVSIKPGVKGEPRGVHFSPLEFRLQNWLLRDVIGSVYNAQRGYSLVGLPKWASAESFSFTAKSIAPPTRRSSGPC